MGVLHPFLKNLTYNHSVFLYSVFLSSENNNKNERTMPRRAVRELAGKFGLKSDSFGLQNCIEKSSSFFLGRFLCIKQLK